MESEGQSSHGSYISAMTLNNLRVPHVPNRYVLPPSERPKTSINLSNTLPIIDISSLQDPYLRSQTIDEIRRALFQVTNHGIPLYMMKEALDAATEFFNLQEEIEEGSQVMAVNYYPACPEPDLALGMPPHSDYGSITILLQSCPGLQLMDHNKNWLSVPVVEGALIVQLGDQIEVMSNGQYKSVIHRVTLTKEKQRLSIASLHSLHLYKKIGPVPKLVDEQHPESWVPVRRFRSHSM